jgi:hypothetical protein
MLGQIDAHQPWSDRGEGERADQGGVRSDGEHGHARQPDRYQYLDDPHAPTVARGIHSSDGSSTPSPCEIKDIRAPGRHIRGNGAQSGCFSLISLAHRAGAHGAEVA